MRRPFAVFAFSLLLLHPALAQGVKDPPNYPLSGNRNSQKVQQLNQPPARPKTVGNLPVGYLPPAVAAQWADHRDKSIAVPRP
jgi:hypothetical protein